MTIGLDRAGGTIIATTVAVGTTDTGSAPIRGAIGGRFRRLPPLAIGSSGRPSTVWSQPVYYDYGQGGNVVYENNSVYIDGQQVASAEEFAESAAVLSHRGTARERRSRRRGGMVAFGNVCGQLK